MLLMRRYNLDMDEIRDQLERTEYKALPMSEQGMLCVANSKQARVTLTWPYTYTLALRGEVVA